MKDLFEQKIQVKRIRDVPHFHDYKGPDNDYEAGAYVMLCVVIRSYVVCCSVVYCTVLCCAI